MPPSISSVKLELQEKLKKTQARLNALKVKSSTPPTLPPKKTNFQQINPDSSSNSELNTSSTLLKKGKKNKLHTETNSSKGVTEPSSMIHTSMEKTSKKKKRDSDSNQFKDLTSLQRSMALKLQGAQFRWLNEQLYTLDSTSAFKLIKEQPQLYDIYHQGFRDQAHQWPEHPLTWIRSNLLSTYSSSSSSSSFLSSSVSGRSSSLNSSKKKITIADMGCGDAELAHSLLPKETYEVHSFDLIAKHAWVTQASMTQVPLLNQVCDAVVYSLSLMNLDYAKAIQEGYRILKVKGQMHIVEVVSRVDHLEEWIQSFETLGLKLLKKKTDHPLFFYLIFEKTAKPNSSSSSSFHSSNKNTTRTPTSNTFNTTEKFSSNGFPALKPCIYKRR